MTLRHPMVFLVDVDNTLIDNDGIQQDLKDHLERVYGRASRVRYWNILEDLFDELGYRDYIGALQRYRLEHPLEVELLAMSSFLVDYPFADRLFPGALAVLKRLGSFGLPVILSDGDVVFQPRKVEHAGLSGAVDGRVLIYVHKEEALNDVERRYPADHYVLVDDKLRILTAVSNLGDRGSRPCSCDREAMRTAQRPLAPFRRRTQRSSISPTCSMVICPGWACSSAVRNPAWR
jgi:FMN phosphatase YigB (HAD superfamily)